ncbi:DUF3244 domain-containing protein [Bacteroides cellulosilyticus]|uniref:DUF3244 domain-containing protein n=1 Tax=Bacteroides cellulosilyticus TaxID=246787 RepID=UPI001C37E1D2|nr:DUF3244 domain-containing protein [Bacteroides cellulosilyticus]MBV3638878.1 DUF3244 domain-containing protein [Bacteroides cellulosilyticus]MBV3662023.1 DUF3244 domain-containing protein [Bacteroides cellulosilyticus]MBV3684144.1 DUF3244 domain-containing protein [Bacteroides cellulosilyticus]MBV3692341.1 DUF3244 domain-containing protein [Bacteroides cellulosilyticus]MBV3709565.1 DUF3244 domain-containing protein [Bacteroides cellulosilyticus]
MKLKLILCLLGMFSLLRVSACSLLNNDGILEKTAIQMTRNDVPFDILTNGDLGDHRSVRPLIPIFVMLDGSNNTLDLYFEQAIGEVDVTISQNGVVLYFSSEYIQTSVLKNIQLELDVSGSFLIEIEGKNGAYAYGQFEL